MHKRIPARLSALLLLVPVGCGPQASPPIPQGPPAQFDSADAAVALPPVWEAARQRGVAFRAVGNEPGWMIEVTPGGSIHLLLDYGQRTLDLPDPGASTDAATGRTLYLADTDSHSVRITIESLVCHDTMSDEVFAETVALEVDGRRYAGCGRSLH